MANPLSAQQLMLQVSPTDYQYKELQWHHNLRLRVRSFLRVGEMGNLVRDILEAVCKKDDGRLYPEMLDYAMRAGIVSYYADVELPEKIDDQYRLLYTTDLYDKVIGVANQGQVAAVREAVRMYMELAARQTNTG